MAQVRTRKRGRTFSYIFETGKRKVVEKGSFATKSEAYKTGVAAYNDYLHGNIGVTSEKITLKNFMSAWLDNFTALNVLPTTMQTYKSVLNVRILPHLGGVYVQELTPAKLNAWLRKLVELGFSYSSIRVAYSIILEALDYAVYPAQLIYVSKRGQVFAPPKSNSGIRKISVGNALLEVLKEWRAFQKTMKSSTAIFMSALIAPQMTF